jgi:hypothetical protein
VLTDSLGLSALALGLGRRYTAVAKAPAIALNLDAIEFTASDAYFRRAEYHPRDLRYATTFANTPARRMTSTLVENTASECPDASGQIA